MFSGTHHPYSQPLTPGFAYSVETRRLAGPNRRRPAKLTQAAFFLLFLGVVFGTTYLLVHFMGLDNMAQLHGLDHVVETMGIEPAPDI